MRQSFRSLCTKQETKTSTSKSSDFRMDNLKTKQESLFTIDCVGQQPLNISEKPTKGDWKKPIKEFHYIPFPKSGKLG